MNINASIVANFFLKKGRKEKIPIDPMKLIKLVYIAHGWGLALLDQDFLNGEKVEVWKHGPVIPSLYHEFKRFKKDPIDEYSNDLIEDALSGFETYPSFLEKIAMDQELKEKISKILEIVWEGYKDYSSWGLSDKTHEEGTPWKKAFEHKEKFIDNGSIKDYYTEFLDDILG